MDLDKIRTVIEEAVSASVRGIELPGISDVAVRSAAVSSAQLRRLAAQIKRHGYGEVELSAEVELFLRASTDLLSSIERIVSELVGPYIDRIATFLGYPLGLVQVMAVRLYEARIWENGEVRSESWFDPEKGGSSLPPGSHGR